MVGEICSQVKLEFPLFTIPNFDMASSARGQEE